ncbi:hypothetical protein B0H10DRAFT_1959981 [Mycena sp. CBHHK59/15]|nr:hypothetical protein B0H10DRAFT_2265797 [Mycena sp. CBHHK59/15]KAJ6596714.1 hypothetical protein B0H10DRAFT_1959981 [Mycena sp. CBHHK59/15]
MPDVRGDDQTMDFDPPVDNPVNTAPDPVPEPAPPAETPPAPRGVSIEEVENEDAPNKPKWLEDYPLPAGCILEQIGPVETIFEAIRRQQREEGQAPWTPFESEADWDLARWLSKTGVSQGDINEFLELEKADSIDASDHHGSGHPWRVVGKGDRGYGFNDIQPKANRVQDVQSPRIKGQGSSVNSLAWYWGYCQRMPYIHRRIHTKQGTEGVYPQIPHNTGD